MTTTSNRIRAFIGISLPNKLNQQLDRDCHDLHQQTSIQQANIRWLKGHNRHMTLAFLGDIKENDGREKWQQLGQTLKSRCTAIDFSHIDYFPDKRSRIIALTGQTNTELTTLQHELLDLFQQQPDKPLRPHITLARIAQHQQLAFTPISCHRNLAIDTIHLYQSTLGPGGSEYEILLSHSLHS